MALIALLLTGCRSDTPPDIHASPDSEASLIRVADDTRANGDLPTAINLYRRAHSKKPSDPVPLERLGSTLTQLKSYTEAARAYRAALDLAPHDPELHRGLATVLLSLNQPDAAVRELKSALDENPDDPRLFNAMGVAHDLLGRHDLAQEDYANGLRLAPQHGGLRNNYALSLALSGNYNAAIELLDKIANDPSAPSRYRLNLALVYGLAGNDRKAAAIAAAVLDQAAVRNNLGYYATLRAMDDKARTAAIISGQIHGTVVAEVPPAKSAPVITEPASPSPEASPSANPDAAPTQSDNAPATNPPTKLAPDANAADQGAAPSEATAPATEQAPSPEPPPAPAPAPADTAPAPSPATEAAPPASPPKSAAPAVPSSYVVQLGSFENVDNAQNLAQQLKGKGYRITVERFRDQEGKRWFAVRAGHYKNATKAAEMARKMRDAGQLPAEVVPIYAQAPAHPMTTAQRG